MAVSEGRMAFVGTGTSTENVIDASSAMTAVNRVQYHQFKGNTPLNYHMTITCVKGGFKSDGQPAIYVNTLPNTWTMSNSLVKTSAGWKKQLRSAGIKLSDLSTYGRRMRVGYSKAHVEPTTGALKDVLVPMGVVQGEGLDSNMEIFPDYTVDDAAGTTVSYESANEVTRLAVPSDSEDTDPVEMNVVALGYNATFTADLDFCVIQNYIQSRGGVTDEPDSASQGPLSTSWLQRFFSAQAPATDEIVEEADDYMNYRPYTDDVGVRATGGSGTNPLNNLCTYQGTLTSPVSVAGNSTTALQLGRHSIDVIAPLGLVQLVGIQADDEIIIDVHAITEM